jgi:hypothetical protein
MKLELKHLAPYLPYRLEAYCEQDKTKHRITIHHQTFDLKSVGLSPMIRCEFYKTFKPILRHLDDLKKDGSDIKEMIEEYSSRCFRWILVNDLSEIRYSTFELLIHFHFDVFGLIDAGLAIDINTL